ncbi:uncharacterized protein LOC107365951 isoform X1 [Tetranychus urticae]|uniref:uncharacterized protein LOC107365951 isoform X1 n=1 Tax=Tetranychus urticae TaxID=32264 RepID=UPI00077BD896|nr:uncharacterized protein LOC107365951 isoform X1 [Tetranychus urticae]
MELDEFFDVQTCSSPSTSATDSESNNSIISSQSTENCESIIQALFPSEDTIKNYLSLDQDNNSDDSNKQSINSSNTTNSDKYRLLNEINHQFEPMQLEYDYLSSQSLLSTSVYPDQTSDDFHSDFNLVPLDAIDYGNSVDLYGCHHDGQWLQGTESNPQSTYNELMKIKGNTLLLARMGYKFAVTLNTDNDKVKELWNPKVGQKILSAFYSPLGLKGNYLSTQVSLDQFESFILTQSINAFEDRTIEPSNFTMKAVLAPSPAQFVSTCKRIKSFKKLSNIDKIVLLSNTMFEFISWKAVFYYNRSIDGWMIHETGSIYERRDCFIWSRAFHDATIQAIEKLPDKWRENINIDVLISLIIIFNPDQPGLKYKEVVRQEQYLYIYLLQRYLESVCESPCDVSENLYRLMVAAERCKGLGRILSKVIEQFEIGSTRLLHNWIVSRINS